MSYSKNLNHRNATSLQQSTVSETLQRKQAIFLSADKGNATVVIHTEEYDTKIKSFLDTAYYKETTINTVTYAEEKTKSLISSRHYRQK